MKNYKNMENLKRILNHFMFVAFFACAISCNYMNTRHVRAAKVLEKERVTKYVNGRDKSYYLIYTDKGEFTIKDELFRGNFLSSKWYGIMKKDKCYTFEVGGYRSGFVSIYQNIHTEPVECGCD